MKASELSVGAVIAVTNSPSKYDRRTTLATKCKVATEPRSGYVGVELLEDARSGLGNRHTWSQGGLAKAGERVRIKTVCAWTPWDRLEVHAENERAQQAQKDREEKESEDRLAELQRRTDQFAGEVDKTLRWGGHKYSHSHPNAEQDYVKVPTAALETLLAKAEGK